MFLSLYTFRHVVFVVTVKDRYFCLQNDRTAVQLVGNEMHGGTMLLIAVLQHLTMGMQARIFRQKRRVDIQQTSVVMRDEGRAQDTHVARQHHHVRRVGVNLLHQLTVKGFTPGELAGF